MKVGCRWPGGMTLTAVLPTNVRMNQFINGPPGQPSITTLPTDGKKPPSRYVAHVMHKRVVDTVKRMGDTMKDAYDATEYGVTDIPGDFWVAWYKENQTNDVIVKHMVFTL